MNDCEPDTVTRFEETGLRIFSGSSNPSLGTAIAESLGYRLGAAHVGRFPDGETIIKLEEDVRGKDCFVVQSTCPPVNENIMELLIFMDSLRRASARRITAVIPYFGYARQDRKAEGRTPITAKLVANLITQAGAHRVLAMDLHADQIQGFFDLPVDHLTAMPVLAGHVEAMGLTDTVVVSPDVGNVKQANAFSERLGSGLAVIEKRRVTGDVIKASRVIGDVAGKTVLMFDDMITTGGTATEAVKILRRHGAKRFLLGASHAVFAGQAVERMESVGLDWILVTDTIPLRAGVKERLPQIQTLSVARLLGEAIKRIHCNESVSALFSDGSTPR